VLAPVARSDPASAKCFLRPLPQDSSDSANRPAPCPAFVLLCFSSVYILSSCATVELLLLLHTTSHTTLLLLLPPAHLPNPSPAPSSSPSGRPATPRPTTPSSPTSYLTHPPGHLLYLTHLDAPISPSVNTRPALSRTPGAVLECSPAPSIALLPPGLYTHPNRLSSESCYKGLHLYHTSVSASPSLPIVASPAQTAPRPTPVLPPASAIPLDSRRL
jgi:hypothetical protein